MTSSYDQLPYDTKPTATSHPDVLTAVARLRGLRPAAIESSRVLEIGCGTGHNLLPMAAALPEATFVGVDLSPVQIEIGQRAVDDMGLENLSLRAGDLRDLDGEPFDTILCHGVYSWVAPDVREALLDRIRSLLAPQGIAFISWNALPGWNVNGALRDLLRWRTESSTTPDEKVAVAREVLAEVERSEARHPLFELVQQRARGLAGASDTYLMHDFLAEHNWPVYLHQFVRHLDAHGLRMVGEAEFGVDAQHGLFSLDGSRAQFSDFQDARTFRRSVVCHASVRVEEPSAEQLGGLFARTVLEPGEGSAGQQTYRVGSTEVLSTESPVLIAILETLCSRAPAPVAVDSLASDHPPDERDRLLFACASHRFIELTARSPPVVSQVGSRPEAWSVARHRARAGGRWVPNLLHQPVAVDRFEAELLSLMDGTRGRAALLDEMALRHPGPSKPREARVQKSLASLVSAALFVG